MWQQHAAVNFRTINLLDLEPRGNPDNLFDSKFEGFVWEFYEVRILSKILGIMLLFF